MWAWKVQKQKMNDPNTKKTILCDAIGLSIGVSNFLLLQSSIKIY